MKRREPRILFDSMVLPASRIKLTSEPDAISMSSGFFPKISQDIGPFIEICADANSCRSSVGTACRDNANKVGP